MRYVYGCRQVHRDRGYPLKDSEASRTDVSRKAEISRYSDCGITAGLAEWHGIPIIEAGLRFESEGVDGIRSDQKRT
jgi:hypothetical protein